MFQVQVRLAEEDNVTKAKAKKVPAKKAAKVKEVVVNAEFLNNLANDIYDPKTKRFLHLCDGTLQNGPCPINESRPMHCGLGELWFAMTGTQPKQKKGLSESDVVDKAVELSTIDHEFTTAEAEIRKLKLPKDAIESLVDHLMDSRGDLGKEGRFREILDEIPTENDGVTEEGEEQTVTAYKTRARSVAKLFRDAAKLLA